MPSSLEDDRYAILKVFTSHMMQYAGFGLTFVVSVLAEMSVLSNSYIPHYLVWAAVVVSGLGALLCLESYLELVELMQICIDERPLENLGGNALGALWEWYHERFVKKSWRGKIWRFRRKHRLVQLRYLCTVVGFACLVLFWVLKVG
jgi:hypothetical protein